MYCAGGSGRGVTRRAAGEGVGVGVWATAKDLTRSREATMTTVVKAAREIDFIANIIETPVLEFRFPGWKRGFCHRASLNDKRVGASLHDRQLSQHSSEKQKRFGPSADADGTDLTSPSSESANHLIRRVLESGKSVLI
jgi:hypothetical protein